MLSLYVEVMTDSTAMVSESVIFVPIRARRTQSRDSACSAPQRGAKRPKVATLSEGISLRCKPPPDVAIEARFLAAGRPRCHSERSEETSRIGSPIPHIPKQLDGIRSIPRVMIVRVRVDLQIALQELPEQLYPVRQMFRPVDNGLIPCRRLLLDILAIAEPTNVDEIRCDQVALCRHFPGSRQEARVRQSQSHIMFSEHLGQCAVEQLLVPNFDRRVPTDVLRLL